jgi:hypothetical protein
LDKRLIGSCPEQQRPSAATEKPRSFTHRSVI